MGRAAAIKPVRRQPARQRLLDAAARVFARDGINGSTTRAIALDAGVNEVTLFRLFQSKDRLLAAVVGQNFGPGTPESRPVPPEPTDDLRADLFAFADLYEAALKENLPLVRTMLGEIQHHHRDHEREVFLGIFSPLKEALLGRLELAGRQGRLRAGVRPAILADLLGGMLFTGVLRRASHQVKINYAAAAYRDTALDLVINGATVETKSS